MDINRVEDSIIDEDVRENDLLSDSTSRPITNQTKSTIKEIYLSSTPSELSSEREIKDQELYGKSALKKYRQKYFQSSKLLQKSEIKGRKVKDPLIKYLN